MNLSVTLVDVASTTDTILIISALPKEYEPSALADTLEATALFCLNFSFCTLSEPSTSTSATTLTLVVSVALTEKVNVETPSFDEPTKVGVVSRTVVPTEIIVAVFTLVKCP